MYGCDFPEDTSEFLRTLNPSLEILEGGGERFFDSAAAVPSTNLTLWKLAS